MRRAQEWPPRRRRGVMEQLRRLRRLRRCVGMAPTPVGRAGRTPRTARRPHRRPRLRGAWWRPWSRRGRCHRRRTARGSGYRTAAAALTRRWRSGSCWSTRSCRGRRAVWTRRTRRGGALDRLGGGIARLTVRLQGASLEVAHATHNREGAAWAETQELSFCESQKATAATTAATALSFH